MSVLSVHVCLPQTSLHYFKNIDKTQGLSNNSVQSIYKDSKGFLWVGTIEGLNRFDGYSFKTFKTNVDDTTSICGNLILFTFEDPNGILYVQSPNGFSQYDPKKNVFKRSNDLFEGKLKVRNHARAMALYDSLGNAWFASQFGLYKYEPKHKNLTKIEANSNKTNSLSSDSVTALQVDNNNQIWVITNNRLVEQIDNSTGQRIRKIELPLIATNFYQMFIDAQNDIWIFNAGNTTGLFVYSIAKGELRFFEYNSSSLKLKNNRVMVITQDGKDNIWIGTDGGGITIYDKTKDESHFAEYDPSIRKSLGSNAIALFFKDKEGTIWVATHKNGLSYTHPSLTKFPHIKIPKTDNSPPTINDIDNFIEDNDGNIWIGTNGAGVLIYNPKTGSTKRMKHKPNDPNSLSADVVIGMLNDSKGRIWIGTYFGGLNCFQNGKNTRYNTNHPSTHKLSDDRVWDVCEDMDGDIWVATLLGGINIIDGKTLTTKQFIAAGDSSTINSFVVFDIYADKNNRLWIATTQGLRCFDKNTKTWSSYAHDDNNKESLSNNLVYATFQDTRGWIWVATTDGLNILDPSSGKFKVLRQKDGLPSNYIVSILEDNSGNIWVATAQGLSHIEITKQPDKFIIHNYDESDGLQGNEFNVRSAFKTKNGELLFGGNNGFNIFNPDKIQTSNIVAPTVITDIQLFNSSIGDNKELASKLKVDSSVSYLKQLTVSHAQNVITIEFANLNYIFPEKRKYKYMLEGFNSDWLTTDAKYRKVTYTNLNPGHYTFNVMSDTDDGSWDEKSMAQIKIVVTPAWWQTLMFKVSMVLALIFAVFLYIRLRTRRIYKQKIILANLVQERTRQLEEANAKLEERQEEIYSQNEELLAQKEALEKNNDLLLKQADEIEEKNKELEMHRTQLESLVAQRTLELASALEQAKESDRLKTIFLQNMSHEIRTPMNAIIGFTSVMKAEASKEHEWYDYIDIINGNCELLLTIINDVLDMSRIEANQINISNETFNVETLLREVYESYIPRKTHDIDVLLDISGLGANPLAFSDPMRIKQILINLTDNALKYTLKGHVRIGSTKEEGHYRFFVEDTGIGIEQGDFDKLFTRFSKLDNKQTKFYQGVGLGLAISKRLVEMLGGNIWLNSELNLGTTFHFTIPFKVTGE